MKADRIIYGNIITMDEKQSRVQAMAIRDDKIVFVGSRDDAQEFVDANTEVIDYGNKTVYPGFIDVHNHIGLLSTMTSGGPSFPYGDSYENNVLGITEFIKENPGKEIYKAFGFTPDAERGFPTHEMLDAIEIDGEKFNKPIVICDINGHLSWLNKAAMEKFGVNKEMAKKYGEDAVLCDEDGEPIGVLKETPHFAVIGSIPVDLEEAKELFAEIQEAHLAHGYSMVGDCGIDEGANPMVTAMGELAKEGRFKLKVRAYYQIFETCKDPLKEVDRAVEFAKKYNDDYFKIVGIKIFLDGVSGGMSCWTLEPYKNYKFKGKPYYGYKRWNYDRIDELAEIIRKANANGLGMELHAIGSGAVRYALDAIEKAQAGCENPDFRNAVSHLNCVDKADVPRFGKLNAIPVAAPQWYVYVPEEIGAEKVIYGEDDFQEINPLQSYLDTGANLAFHSDGDPDMEVGRIFFTAVNKTDPIADPDMEPRNLKERMSAYDAVKCMTTNAAYVLGEEKNVGTLEVGKKADFVVYDADFTDEKVITDPKACDIPPTSLYVNGNKIF